MGGWYVLGLVAFLVELVATVVLLGVALWHAPSGRAAGVIVLAYATPIGFGVAGAFLFAAPLHRLAAWPGGSFTALVLPALLLGHLRMWKFAVGCGLVFAFWQPDHRLIALFVLPLIAMAFF